MGRITDRNSNGSIDIVDPQGRTIYTIENNENGLIAYIGRELAEYEDAEQEKEIAIEADLTLNEAIELFKRCEGKSYKTFTNWLIELRERRDRDGGTEE